MFDGLPVWAAFAGLFVIVLLRANATYWVGRGLRAGAGRTRLAGRLDGRAVRRAEALMARWGVAAVPLSFLTLGVQTAVNVAAGAMRMPLRHYLPAVVVGAALWATVYSALGGIVVTAVRGLFPA